MDTYHGIHGNETNVKHTHLLPYFLQVHVVYGMYGSKCSLLVTGMEVHTSYRFVFKLVPDGSKHDTYYYSSSIVRVLPM